MGAGNATPKQFLPLLGRTVLRRAAEGLAKTVIPECLVVVHAQDHALMVAESMKGFDACPVRYAFGGADRTASVRAGLAQMTDFSPDTPVFIHDAARPLIDGDAIARLLAVTADNATLALQVSDTLWNDTAVAPLSREHVWRVQTPQRIRLELLCKAHENAVNTPHTDDCSLVHTVCGVPPVMVPGSAKHHKLTTPEDMPWLERLVLSEYGDVRTGQGFDVHRFVSGSGVRLFGVDIDCPMALEGHSDADVGLHALCDAIYAAIGDGDIGVHFPPSNAAYKGMDSAVFLQHALDRLNRSRAILSHVSLTLLGEQPRIMTHRDAILNRLSALLTLPRERIGLVATTTEKLGFIGRKEGVACMALATVRTI